MRRANIKGALVGVEAVTPEGLKAVYKDWNYSGDGAGGAVADIPEARGACAGLFHLRAPDRQAEHLRRDGGNGDEGGRNLRAVRDDDAVSWNGGLCAVGKGTGRESDDGGGLPITRYWLIPAAIRPKMFTPHPMMSSDEIRERTQKVWDRFYEMGAIWKRSRCAPTLGPASGSYCSPVSIARCMQGLAFRRTAPG